MEFKIIKYKVIISIILSILFIHTIINNYDIFNNTIITQEDGWIITTQTGIPSEDFILKQRFIPSHNYIKSIDVSFISYFDYIGNEDVEIALYSSRNELIYKETIDLKEMNNNEYKFHVESKVNPNKEYYFSIIGLGKLKDYITHANYNTDKSGYSVYEQQINIITTFEYKLFLYKPFIAIFVLFFVLIIMLNIKIQFFDIIEVIYHKIPIVIKAYILSLMSFFNIEFLCNNSIFSIQLSSFLLSTFLYFLIYLLILIFITNYKIALIVPTVLLYIVGVLNYFVVFNRTNPIMPWDIFSISTAFSVRNNYDFPITINIILVTLIVLNITIAIMRFDKGKSKVKIHCLLSAFSIIYICIFGYSFYNTSMLSNLNLAPNVWMQSEGYSKDGFILSFMMNTKYLFVDKPEGYHPAVVENLNSQYTTSENEVYDEPNIIAIMNESFTDLRVINDFKTNEEYMPFLDNLNDNTVKGNLYVPVFGGYTCNTEFEFLTGNSMAFLPVGSVPYQQYIQKNTNSINTILKKYGYKTIAIHPFYSTGWNRDKVYPYLEFDDFLDISSFADAELIRGYVSDNSMYDKIIDLYENKKFDEKLFIFGVTMQNHGGYSVDTKLKYNIKVEDRDDYPQTNQYLSLIRQSDDAIRDLINYFKDYDEKTVILIFGDHMPAIENAFYEKLYGQPLNQLGIEEIQKRYVTPFYIWANYDIEEQYVEKISSNYLSTLLVGITGLEGTNYQKYASNLFKEIPVISVFGYIDNEDTYNTYNAINNLKATINQYSIIQYNNLFDKKRFNQFFR